MAIALTDIPFVTVSLKVERVVSLATMPNLVELLDQLGLATSAQEQLWTVSLDSRNNVRNICVAAIGTYHEVHTSVPSAVSPVLLSAADRFIMAHNHPNGKPNPTNDDIDLTARIQSAARVLGIDFDDHIILTPSGAWSSMRSLGYL